MAGIQLPGARQQAAQPQPAAAPARTAPAAPRSPAPAAAAPQPVPAAPAGRPLTIHRDFWDDMLDLARPLGFGDQGREFWNVFPDGVDLTPQALARVVEEADRHDTVEWIARRTLDDDLLKAYGKQMHTEGQEYMRLRWRAIDIFREDKQRLYREWYNRPLAERRGIDDDDAVAPALQIYRDTTAPAELSLRRRGAEVLLPLLMEQQKRLGGQPAQPVPTVPTVPTQPSEPQIAGQ